MPGGPYSLGMVQRAVLEPLVSRLTVSSECDALVAHVSPSFCKLSRQPQTIWMCYEKVGALSACGILDRH
jgi:hypothetical protein